MASFPFFHHSPEPQNYVVLLTFCTVLFSSSELCAGVLPASRPKIQKHSQTNQQSDRPQKERVLKLN